MAGKDQTDRDIAIWGWEVGGGQASRLMEKEAPSLFARVLSWCPDWGRLGDGKPHDRREAVEGGPRGPPKYPHLSRSSNECPSCSIDAGTALAGT